MSILEGGGNQKRDKDLGPKVWCATPYTYVHMHVQTQSSTKNPALNFVISRLNLEKGRVSSQRMAIDWTGWKFVPKM